MKQDHSHTYKHGLYQSKEIRPHAYTWKWNSVQTMKLDHNHTHEQGNQNHMPIYVCALGQNERPGP